MFESHLNVVDEQQEVEVAQRLKRQLSMRSFENDPFVRACLILAVFHVEIIVVGYVLPHRTELVLVDESLAVDYEVADLPALEQGAALHT